MASTGKPRGNPAWVKGEPVYSKILAAMTPEEKEKHLADRRKAKEERKAQLTMKQAMKEVIDANREQWLATFNNAAVVLMKQALENGDVQSFTAVYDRFVGKPESNVDITSNGSTVKAPVIIFESAELDEWKDDRKV